jgi:hypothetical protein
MSDVLIATKVCGDCREEKPLSDFHRDRSTRDGHRWDCKVCNRAKVTERQRQAREADPEGFARRNRESVARSRTNPAVRERGNQVVAARSAASEKLIKRHRPEFDALLRTEKYERGLL